MQRKPPNKKNISQHQAALILQWLSVQRRGKKTFRTRSAISNKTPTTFQRPVTDFAKLLKLAAYWVRREVDSPSAGAILHLANEFQMQTRVLVHCYNAKLELTGVCLLKFPPAVQLGVKNGGSLLLKICTNLSLLCPTATYTVIRWDIKTKSWP